MKIRIIVISIITATFLAACASSPTETIQSEQPTQIAAQPTATPSPAPTNTLEPTETPQPTATNTPSPTPTATAVPLTILEPAPESTVSIGTELTIRGIDETAVSDTLTLTIAISDWLLAEGETTIATDGTWEITLPLPPQISGPATLTVQSTTTQNSQTALINIEANTDPNNPFVLLSSPALNDTAVAGYGIVFNGEINKPYGRSLVIGVMRDNCTRFVTGSTFELGNGQWEGLLVIPSDAIGSACAVARSGNPDESEEWMAAIVPLNILALKDENATNITLGNPGELVFSGSEILELYGTAVNAPLNEIDILLTSDDGNYKLLANDTASVNSYGYWEIDLELSETYKGHALLTASMGNDEDYYELRVPLFFTR